MDDPIIEQQEEQAERIQAPQIRLSDDELSRLSVRIEADFNSAIGDHQKRIERFNSYLKIWRQLCDEAVKKGDSAFSVPLMEWHVHGKLAQIVSLILGADAEIIAVPVGPSDHRIVHKISRYMQWLVFSCMKAVVPMVVWIWMCVFFGRGIAYRPWRVDDREIGDNQTERDYDGPGFEPLDPDDIILPADNARSVHHAAFVIRRYWLRPDDLLVGEEQGKYFGIKENFEELVQHSRNPNQRDWQTDTLKRTQDRAEGVDREGNLTYNECIRVHEWYGKWRMLKPGKDGDQYDLDARELRETDVVVTCIPALKRVISVQRLAELYPKMRRRRPFSELCLGIDGSAWPKGLGEMLYNLQNSIDSNERLFDVASRIMSSPPILFDPADGWDPEAFEIEPNMAIPCKNPANVQQLKIQGNLQPILERTQAIMAFAERLSRVTEQNLGRSQPNVTTAAGQLALIEQSNVGVALDTTLLREGFGVLFQDLWELSCCFCDERTFFRVTEEDAKGLFDVDKGGAVLTSEERGGKYDFLIKFATSVWSRQAKKQEAIQVYQLDLANPLVAGNPKALWVAANKLHKALDAGDFSELVPEPPDIEAPKRPEQEWALVLQGEDVHVHPMDNDQMHINDHLMRIAKEERAKEPDLEAINRMIAHVVDHQIQKRDKALQQATIQALAGPGGGLEALMGGAMGGPQQPMPGGGGE